MSSIFLLYYSKIFCKLNCSLPGSSIHGILQVRILEWGAIPFSRESSWPGNWTQVSCAAGRFFTIWATREAPLSVLKVKVIQSRLTLCDPMDYTDHGFLQARILEWVAIPISRGSSRPKDQTRVSPIVGRFFTSWATRQAPKYWSG